VIEGIIPAEIRDEPAAIRATLAEARPAVREAARLLRTRGTRRVFVIGNGTSYHTALAAAALHRRWAGPEDPAVIALTAGDFRVYRPALAPTDAVVGVSASGEFRDVVAVFEELAGRLPTIAIVHVAGSTLDRVAGLTVRSGGGPSRVPVMTKTFAATLVATQLVLAELLGEEQGERYATEATAAASAAEAAITATEQLVDPLAGSLASAEHLFVVGSGLASVAAMEAALKLKEMAIVHAEPAESWEMASGAATIVRPCMVVVALAPAGPGREATLDVARHAAGWGARVVEVGPGSAPAVAGADHLPLPAGAAEDHAPLAAVPPVALLAFALARRRGHDPDRPGWVERYHSQGLRHIVGVGEEEA